MTENPRESPPGRMGTREVLAYLGLCLMTVGWAAAFIAGKVVLAEISPLAAAAVRYLVAALVLLPLGLRVRPGLPELRKVAFPLTVLILCGGLLYPWLFLLALQHTTATNASLLIALNPVMSLFLGAAVGFGLERRRLPGAFLALAGAALVITRGDWRLVGGLAGGGLRSGDLLSLVAAFCWACFNVALRPVVHVLTASFTNFLVYGLGGVVLALLAGPIGMWEQVRSASAAAHAGLFVMAVVSSVLSGQMFYHGARVVGVNRTVVFIYVTPVLTAFASVLWLGEALVPAHLLGGAAVLGGVYWSNRIRTPR